MLSGNSKLKKQSDSVRHSLQGLKSETLTSPNATEHVEKQELWFTAGGNAKWGDWLFQNTFLPYDLTIVFLDIYPNELKTYARTKTCLWMVWQLYHNCQNLGGNRDVL